MTTSKLLSKGFALAIMLATVPAIGQEYIPDKDAVNNI